MVDKPQTIERVQDLLVLLEPGEGTDTIHWFRGQAVAAWPLLPWYFRLDQPPSETTLLNRFRQNAARLIEAPARNDFDWMFLMQHYGAPTRLLDWSENPLTALYFSVNDFSKDQDDGALWMLDPIALNRNANIHNKDEANFIPSFDDEEISSYSIDSVRTSRRAHLKPVATIATRNSARIQAQAGVFTIHHLDTGAIEAIGDGAHVRKFVIPAKSKEKLRRQLKILGFTRFHLFPELESVGASVRENVR